MTCINSSGLYSQVLTSRKPEAKRAQVVADLPGHPSNSQDRQLLCTTKAPAPATVMGPDGQVPETHDNPPRLLVYLELHLLPIGTRATKGFVFPEGTCLDISVGKCWCSYLRSQGTRRWISRSTNIITQTSEARKMPTFIPTSCCRPDRSAL